LVPILFRENGSRRIAPSSSAWWNLLRPLPAVGGKPSLHAVEPNEQDVWMDIGERVEHTLMLGTTRVGKTRLAELLITQDIRRGDVVIVFDPKGDADQAAWAWVNERSATARSKSLQE
jgi:hypothetical protein